MRPECVRSFPQSLPLPRELTRPPPNCSLRSLCAHRTHVDVSWVDICAVVGDETSCKAAGFDNRVPLQTLLIGNWLHLPQFADWRLGGKTGDAVMLLATLLNSFEIRLDFKVLFGLLLKAVEYKPTILGDLGPIWFWKAHVLASRYYDEFLIECWFIHSCRLVRFSKTFQRYCI